MADVIPAGDAGVFKTCTKCGETKSLGEFSRDKNRRDGLFPHCKVCARARSSRWYAENTARGRENAKRTRTKNPGKAKLYLTTWYLENKEIVSLRRAAAYAAKPEAERDRSKKWAKGNPDRVRERSAKRRKDPKFRLENAFRIAVSGCIRRGTKKSSTFDILGYSPDDLRSHLEAKFTDGMTWDNYGRDGWHVDHVLPLASFSFETPDCADFKKAFALSNLQPLWQSDNCSKRDRLDHPSQAAMLAA